MDLKLNNKRALVSGSARGIGRAIALKLVEEGAMVIINGRSEASVSAALAEIKQSCPMAHIDGFVGNLADVTDIARLTSRYAAVDILVNNLGIFEPKPFEEIPDADWLRLFETNVMSGVRLSRAYLPGMKERNWGRIVFISSESAIQIPTEMIHYGMTKTAQLAISRGLAETCIGTGVTVNAVLPGPTRSAGVEEFVAHMSDGQPFEAFEQEFFQKFRPSSLLKRFATTEEVAAMVTYLCSPLSSATNGAALRVDGGVIKSCF
jgi:NAD(P)-dependent dehydrogenase (short-subunit alcohol dehydrogenase family)